MKYLLAALVLVAGPALAQERIAQLSAVNGAVTVTRAADGSVDRARQIGPRVRNGSVYAGDVVSTGASAEATLVFSDESRIDLSAGTSLSIQEVDQAALLASGKADKPVGRKIRVLAGDIWTHVSPNPSVSTEFETPSGVAAVKGTTLRIAVGEDTEGATR